MKIGSVISSIAQIANRDHDLLQGLGDDDHTQYLDWTNRGKRIVKDADEIVNNSTVLQNDDHFSFAIGANEIWLVLILPRLTNFNTANYMGDWSLPAGASRAFMMFTTTSVSYGGNVEGQTNDCFGGAGAIRVIVTQDTEVPSIIYSVIYNGANDGTAQWQWAQAAAKVKDSTEKANSILIAIKIA